MTAETHFPRGAEWRQWDLHIHTPASFHWLGRRFDADPNSAANIALVDEMIAALNAAEPAVFALMDYWTFEGWFALKRRLAQHGAPKLLKRVFPGIELRLMAPMAGRLNAHVLFSDAIEDQMLRDFKAALHVELVNRPLSDDSLIALARMVGEDKLKHHGLKKVEIDADPNAALQAGSVIAEISCDSYKTAIGRVPHGYAIGFMPFNTSDGLAEVKWHEHYAFCLGLFKSSPIFETRDLDTRGAFTGERTPGNEKWIDNFQKALGGIPRLAVSGSDAHCFIGNPGDNNRRGYGDFPSGKATWIKSDTTFLGLLQAIKEPAKRSYIGEQPKKVSEVEQNKTFFINSVSVAKVEGSTLAENWLSNCELPLNADLVAIIGNKGSGKSALADVIALLGNSRQKAHFSFLKKDRFRGKAGEPAKHFIGKLNWRDDTTEERRLSEDPPDDKVELVRYIPQGHFEELCNDHISGRTNAFERELRAVIFSHASDAIRLGALDFDQLIEQQESSYRDQLGEFRKDLRRLNQEIAGIEEQLQPEVKRALQELLAQKKKQVEEHQKIKPETIPKPEDQLTPEQQQTAAALEVVSAKLKALEDQSALATSTDANLAAKAKAIQNVRERLRLFERQYKQFQDETAKDLAVLGLSAVNVVQLSVNIEELDKLGLSTAREQEALKVSVTKNSVDKQTLANEQTTLNARLNAPQLLYQQNQKTIETWQEKLRELTGTAEAPETLMGVEARIAQLDKLPEKLLEKESQRLHLTSEIFDILDEQRKARERLFEPVQKLIQSNSLIRDEYKLQFQATLSGSPDVFAGSLFELIKQASGEFRGPDDSFSLVRKIFEQLDLNKKTEALAFVSEMHKKIATAAAASGNKSGVGIASVLRKDKIASDVYDLLYGLSLLEPRYSLLFQETHIEQLSPGQRGALLLIFYLLVDKGRNPIILDQPEENLDNETVVSLLVPVLTEAKKERQIIMVTHNPNLAVVCDAEQVIYSTFNRKSGATIEYLSGSIENPIINSRVVDVLEGTKPAFDNRRIKYH